jgi:hypothetical protein
MDENLPDVRGRITRPKITLETKETHHIPKASERNPALRREELIGEVLKHFSFEDTSELYKATLAYIDGLAGVGFDTLPIGATLRSYGRLSSDRGGAGRNLARDILQPQHFFNPGLGIPLEEEEPGMLARFFGFFASLLPGRRE